jgi:DNA-directed RNA polymerase specialized sigma24 family protein
LHSLRRVARKALQDSTLTDFRALVKEAKISDEIAEILELRFVRGLSIVQIADRQHCSVEKVNRSIKIAYDKIFKLL